jgi:hypothetical protein
MIVDFVRSYRDRQPTEAMQQWVNNAMLWEMLIAAHACDPVRSREEQLATESGDPPEIVMRRAEVAGWRHLIHEASKRLHMAEDDLAEATTLRIVP